LPIADLGIRNIVHSNYLTTPKNYEAIGNSPIQLGSATARRNELSASPSGLKSLLMLRNLQLMSDFFVGLLHFHVESTIDNWQLYLAIGNSEETH
jgi:hypothetical protein